ncbi:MAG TPA: hypothetical protein VGK67_15035 [Myxococcales bacterium]|jgi:hypothetical protein
MNRLKHVVALLFAVLASPGARAADSAEPSRPSLEYSPGTLQGGFLSSALPRGVCVDWEALAKENITDVNLDEPTAADRKKIAKLSGKIDWDPSLHFDTPLPPELAKYSFFLLTDAGIAPLKPKKLCGTVRFAFGQDGGGPAGSERKETHYFGSLCFEKGPKVEDGMVLMSPAPIEPKVEKLGPKQTRLKTSFDGKIVTYEWAEPGKEPLRLTWGFEHAPKPVMQYRVDLAGHPPLLFVRWGREPTAMPCDQMSDLFEVGDRLEKVFSSPRCDFSPTRSSVTKPK